MFTYSQGVQIVSIISIVCSLSVLLTLGFKSLRQKLFMQIIAMISFCDLVGNTPYITTNRYSGNTGLCTLEGFINVYFYPVGWMWTTVLMWLLYSLATTGELPMSYRALHAICWLFPFLLAMLNLATETNSRSKAAPEKYAFEICTLGDLSLTSELYHLFTYYGLLILCILIMIGMYIKIRSTDQGQVRSNFPMYTSARNTLILYPVALFVCWLPHLIAVVILDFASVPNMPTIYFASDILKILHGCVTSAIFFSKSNEARSRWSKLFFKAYNAMRVACGMRALETTQTAIVGDFSVEYDNMSFRSTSADSRSQSDDKQINGLRNWRINSNDIVITVDEPISNKIHEKNGELRDSIVEMS